MLFFFCVKYMLTSLKLCSHSKESKTCTALPMIGPDHSPQHGRHTNNLKGYLYISTKFFNSKPLFIFVGVRIETCLA